MNIYVLRYGLYFINMVMQKNYQVLNSMGMPGTTVTSFVKMRIYCRNATINSTFFNFIPSKWLLEYPIYYGKHHGYYLCKDEEMENPP